MLIRFTGFHVKLVLCKNKISFIFFKHYPIYFMQLLSKVFVTTKGRKTYNTGYIRILFQKKISFYGLAIAYELNMHLMVFYMFVPNQIEWDGKNYYFVYKLQTLNPPLSQRNVLTVYIIHCH